MIYPFNQFVLHVGIVPETHSKGMISWFPIFFPLKVCFVSWLSRCYLLTNGHLCLINLVWNDQQTFYLYHFHIINYLSHSFHCFIIELHCSVFDKFIWHTIGPKSFLFGTAQFSLWVGQMAQLIMIILSLTALTLC